MNKTELKTKLDALGINEKLYSLDGLLLPNRIVLHNSSELWNVFYFDEEGNKSDEITFRSEEKACQYIYEVLSRSLIK